MLSWFVVPGSNFGRREVDFAPRVRCIKSVGGKSSRESSSSESQIAPVAFLSTHVQRTIWNCQLAPTLPTFRTAHSNILPCKKVLGPGAARSSAKEHRPFVCDRSINHMYAPETKNLCIQTTTTEDKYENSNMTKPVSLQFGLSTGRNPPFLLANLLAYSTQSNISSSERNRVYIETTCSPGRMHNPLISVNCRCRWDISRLDSRSMVP